MDHIVVWFMQGGGGKDEPLDSYPSMKDIFAELAWQANTKVFIPTIVKNIDQPIVEPLTNQKNEEDYEVHLHISNFTLEDTLT